MKTLITSLLSLLCAFGYSQITTSQIKANFGIDADLQNNFFNGVQLPDNDDWFPYNDPGFGIYVIDTTDATQIYNTYLTDISSRNKTLEKRMSYQPFSVVNNQLLMDAVFVRDFHGDDSTTYAAGSNKNGMSPANWSCPIAQSVPDKNEILDVMLHVRRAGTNRTDSLWMFGAVSIQNTTGNRYFDFEMFQTDISYDKSTQTFSGYGPDAGHTSWEFDAAGNVTKAGDIVFTSEYGTASITLIEARIWIDKNSLSITPVAFDWGGQFDGANSGSQFGYASIVPKAAGAFYSGLQCTSATWAGPFGIVFDDNSVGTDYAPQQFMEFSVNLTKLGLDPAALLGGTTCDQPFQKVMVKTRASTSFTAELKDFVGPFKFFAKPSVALFTDVPVFCGVVGVSNLRVINPNPSTIYNWSTPDGHFLDTSISVSVFVDAPGTYIVTSRLNADCPAAASDSITITFDVTCGILLNNELNFAASLDGAIINIKWNALKSEPVEKYILERSADGVQFDEIKTFVSVNTKWNEDKFISADHIENFSSNYVFYRLKMITANKQVKQSKIIRLGLSSAHIKPAISVIPNPVIDNITLKVFTPTGGKMHIAILDATGQCHYSVCTNAGKGSTQMNLGKLPAIQNGVYFIKVLINGDTMVSKIVVNR